MTLLKCFNKSKSKVDAVCSQSEWVCVCMLGCCDFWVISCQTFYIASRLAPAATKNAWWLDLLKDHFEWKLDGEIRHQIFLLLATTRPRRKIIYILLGREREKTWVFEQAKKHSIQMFLVVIKKGIQTLGVLHSISIYLYFDQRLIWTSISVYLHIKCEFIIQLNI